jgi:hypothetical protein
MCPFDFENECNRDEFCHYFHELHDCKDWIINGICKEETCTHEHSRERRLFHQNAIKYAGALYKGVETINSWGDILFIQETLNTVLVEQNSDLRRLIVLSQTFKK